MSASNLLGFDGKLLPSVFPAVNPYPPGAAVGLGDVLQVNNSALTPTGPPLPQSITDVGTLGCADIQAPFGSILSLNSDLIQNGITANLGILPAGNLTLKGCQTKGSLLVGDGTSSKELVVPAGPPLPNGSVLILDSNEPLGMKWGGEAGDINSITPGNNIDITGPTANPIVAVRDPLNATLNLGSQNLTGGFPPLATSMAQNYIIGTQFYDVGGSGVKSAEYAPTIMGLYTPLTNTGEVQIQPLNIQVKGPNNSTPSSTKIEPTLTTIELLNGPSGALQQATITPQTLHYVSTDSGTPTLTNTSTYDNCSRTSVSLDNTTGATATRTEIIDYTLQSRQQQTLVSPSANTTSTINCNCEIITSVPQAYLQLLTDNSTSLISTGFGATANDTQAEMAASFTNTTSGSEYQGAGNILCNGGGSTMTLTSANIAGASSQLLRLECGLIGDALIEHTAVGSARNLDITSTGQINFNSTNIQSTATNFKLLNSAAGGALNPLLTLTNTNATGSVAMEVYKDKPTVGLAGDPLFTQSTFGKDSGNNKQEYTRITHTIRNNASGGEEGSIEMGCFIGGTYANMIQLNGVDTPDGEVNVLRPIDLSTGSTGLIKTSGTGSVNLTLDATTSAGTGDINIIAKNRATITADPAQAVVLEGNSIELNGASLVSVSAGSPTGTYLQLIINGTTYYVALLNP